MHQSSYENMKDFVQTNFPNLALKRILRLLDVGSLDVNGSYRDLFDTEFWSYDGLDMERGKNVDFVPTDPYDWNEIKNNTYDLVISGQALEHIEFRGRLLKTLNES